MEFQLKIKIFRGDVIKLVALQDEINSFLRTGVQVSEIFQSQNYSDVIITIFYEEKRVEQIG